MRTAYETRHAAGDALPVHRHAESYAALVLDGGYEEVTADGRFACAPGMLVIHPAWHAHGDAFGVGGAVVLNLPAPAADGFSAIRVSDPEALERLARRDPLKAAEVAREECETVPPLSPAHWLVRLTRLLSAENDLPIEAMAAQCGVSAEHAARACKRWFGLSPVQLRKERRLQAAIALLRAGASPAEAASGAGFADQPHLTRLLKQATGHTPARFPAR
ncbi:AraC family transcriptional regulator [Hyphobacterium sp. HN65]|uniref:AraC family transcriptional regulator n=1 Tax=Hyphobacterium lacteum TaxID=3116575 RepID=A0ABU7LTA0_9PROT|nr:AraC family transcriptional regulator [Hyphobacterium sp. HN65]MEE2526876.1 AraC family transcriptional regulator [Hyphobacterium sp. HN65]